MIRKGAIGLLALLGFCLGVWVASEVVEALSETPGVNGGAKLDLTQNTYIKEYTEKRILLDENSSRYETAVIGSSHVVNGIVPSVISKLIGGRVLNYGLGGTLLKEQSKLLDDIVESCSGRPVRVVIEVWPRFDSQLSQTLTARSSYFSDIKRLFFVGKFIESTNISFANKTFHLCSHLVPTFIHYLGIGDMSRLLFPEPVELDENILLTDGYPLRKNPNHVYEKYDMHFPDIKQYYSRRIMGDVFSKSSVDFYLNLSEQLQRKGFIVYFFTMPNLEVEHVRLKDEMALKLKQAGLCVFDLMDYCQNAELYQRDFFGDRRHYNNVGAIQFSKQLADAIAEQEGL